MARLMLYSDVIQVRLPPGLAAAIQRAAERQERTVSEVVRDALRCQLQPAMPRAEAPPPSAAAAERTAAADWRSDDDADEIPGEGEIEAMELAEERAAVTPARKRSD